MHLIPYTPAYFPLLNSWITSRELLLLYSGPLFHYPLQETELEAYRAQYPERKMYMAIEQAELPPFAFGEIIPQDSSSVRLARLLIGDPQQRGKGLGLAFVNLLLHEARREFKAQWVDLNVMEDNYAAIRCYEKAGFRFFTEEKEIIPQPDGKAPVVVLKMRAE